MKTERFYQKCLREGLAERLQKNPRYSLRAFAKALQVDPSSLSKILTGQKIPTPKLSKKIIERLALVPQDQKRFLFSMAKAYEEDGVLRKKPEIKKLLKKPAINIAERDLSLEVFRIISDWYHYAILQLAQSKNFQSNPKWIARQLNIQEMEAKLAVDRLKALELLEEKEGRWVRTSERLTTGDLALTTPALRKRIQQITEKSIYSLENDPIAERNHTTMTMNIDPEKIPIAKEMIQEFMDQLSEALETKMKRVYELQINLFPLQRNES